MLLITQATITITSKRKARSFALTKKGYLPGGNCAKDTDLVLTGKLHEVSIGNNL